MALTLTRRNGQVLTLTPLGTNQLAAFEETLGKSFGRILVELGVFGIEGWSLVTTRIVLRACCQDDLSIEQWGDIIDELGFDTISSAVNGLIGPAQQREAAAYA